MKAIHRPSPKGDPSEIQQHFPSYDLQLLCCRFWRLMHWEFNDLSFPYWRLYHNKQKGAFISRNNKTIEISPDKIYLIAPNTSYSTHLFDKKSPDQGFRLEGRRVTTDIVSKQQVQHFFTHFSLGVPYDTIRPEIFVIDLNSSMEQKIDTIITQLKKNAVQFSFDANLSLRALINELLCNIAPQKWLSLSQDERISKALNHIENNLSSELSNDLLAKEVSLATNSFTRLFTEEIGLSPQRYIKQKRIDKSCIMLHHSNLSIEQIAEECGFADRYHFSRIFKKITDNSPAAYRKIEVLSE